MWETMRLFGVDMRSQMRRRWLVTVTYVVLWSLWGLCWWGDATFGLGSGSVWILNAIVYSCLLIFGGSGGWGLVKPFSKRPSWSWSTQHWTNDELDERRRDRAHYLSGQTMLIMVTVIYCAATFSERFHLSAVMLRAALSATLLVGMTLPPASILWTMPDVPVADEEENAEGEHA